VKVDVVVMTRGTVLVKVGEEAVVVVTVRALTVLVKVEVGKEVVTVVTLQYRCPSVA
jgi:hypothetical protein